MKNTILVLTTLVLLITGLKVNASSIGFAYPSNGTIINGAGYGSTQTTVPFSLVYTSQPSSSASYVKLFPTPYPTEQDPDITQSWNLPPGTYTWRLELYEGNELGQYFKTAEQTITFYVKHTLYVSNNFGDGNIIIDNIEQPCYSSALKFTGDNLSVGAIDQSFGSNYYVWNQSGVYNSEWQKRSMGGAFSSISGGTTRNFNYNVASNDNGAAIQAQLRKVCNITFQNNFGSDGNGGSITVNGTQYSSPTSGFTVVEQNPISATAIDQTINGVAYSFSNWSNGSTTRTTTFYPGDNTTISANFVRHVDVQISGPDYIQAGTNYNWTATVNYGHSPYSYQWYYMYPSNILYSPNIIRPNLPARDVWYTIGGNSSTLTAAFPTFDGINLKCVVTDSHNEVATSNIMVIVSGVSKQSAGETSLAESKMPTEYGLFQNHPNPFNPTTMIQYQLPENGLVTLKVFDIVGNEVETLVNGYRSAGSYSVNFDASNLPSGIYFYQIKANNYFAVKKMLMVK